MPIWLYTILIGGAILGLCGLVYKLTVANLVDKLCTERKRINEVRAWINERPTKDELLTRSAHGDICHKAMTELGELIRGQYHETKAVIKEKHDEVKVVLDKISNVVDINSNRLTSIESELKHMNGKK